MAEPKTIEQKKATHFAVKAVGMPKVSIKDVDTASGVVTGFFNSYNFFDSDNDIMMPGAMAKTMAELGPNSNAPAKIKHAFMHDLNKLVGKIQVLRDDYFSWNGIKVQGQYFETKMARTELGQDTLMNYQDGIYDNHSIGFRYMQLEFIEKDADGWNAVLQNLVNPEDANNAGYAYLVKEIMQYEGSTVSFGANKLTPYLGTKSENKEDMVSALYKRLDKLNRVLKTGKQSDRMMETFSTQVLQIKQMVAELIENQVEDPKQAAKKEAELKKNAAKQINYEEIVSKISLA